MSIAGARVASEIGQGVFEASDVMVAEFESVVHKSCVVKLQLPSKSLLSKIPNVSLKGSQEIYSRKLITAVTETYCLDEIWGQGGRLVLPPFANFAYAKAVQDSNQFATQELAALLSELDPVTPMNLRVRRAGGWNRSQKLVPLIDLMLSPIVPAAIFARKYVASDKENANSKEFLKKTENAEKRHQDILRDLSVRLSELGFRPMQSASLDLFVQVFDRSFTFEIKSSDTSNILYQAAKGLFQLGCYDEALSREGYENNHPALIVESCGSVELEVYVDTIIEGFGIPVFYYYSNEHWPRRVSGRRGSLERYLAV